MLRATLKWGGLAFAVIAIVVFTGSHLTSKTFRVETVIPAPPDAVWAVLMDTQNYSQWNPLTIGIDGFYAQGETLANDVLLPNGELFDSTTRVETLIESRKLHQKGGIPLILASDHRWILEPVDGGTKVVQHEVDRGIALWFWNSDWVEPAYSAVNEALSERVQSISAN